MKKLRRLKKSMSFGETLIKKPTFYSRKYFTEREFRILSLNKKNIDYYLTESLRYQTIQINNRYKDILNDKILFYDFFNRDIPIAKNLYYIDSKKRVIDLSNKGRIVKVEDMVRSIKTSKIIAKPVEGGGGHGVFKLEYLDRDTWNYDGEKIDTITLITKILSIKDYLFTEFVEQSQSTKVLNPQSTNTFRVMMIRNPITGEVKTIRVLLRIGNKKTGIADNFDDGDGGLIGKIDLDSETLDSVTMITEDYFPKLILNHPDHGTSFENRKFPGLKKAIIELERVFESYPLFNYVGWDLVLTDDGYSIIEANNHPSFLLAQIYEPLMQNEDERKFYQYWMDLK